MSAEASHIALAKKNHEAMLHLLDGKDDHLEWMTVTAFYKAVQLSEAAFANAGNKHSHGHDARADALKQFGNRMMYRHYRPLWNVSCVARYMYNIDARKPCPSIEDYFTSASSGQNASTSDMVKKFLNKRLRGFESEIVKHLSDNGKKALVRLEKLEVD